MDEVDEWFFDSIQRYNKLQMFTLNENVNHIDFSSNPNNICVSNVNIMTKKCQILEYALPSKFLDIDDSQCSSHHNLKIVCGTYVDQLILELKVIVSSSQVVTSEKNQSCINVYSLPRDDTDKITKSESIPYETEEPHISCHSQSENLCLSHSTNHPISLVDLNTKDVIQKINVDWHSTVDSHVRTTFLNNNTVCVCIEHSGLVHLYDLRCPSEVLSSSSKDKSKPRGVWTMSLLENSTTLNLLSSKAQVQMLDVRNLSKPTFHTQLHIKNKLSGHHLPQIETCPHDPRQFSVSGFNENVHIYSRDEEALCDEVFTHDAHPYQEQCDDDTRVLCHRWMPAPYERMLMSSADNFSFTCVQFNSKLSSSVLL
ncbi:hypothetical protein M8J77_012889 [Diaphorina citri]|nr:hypothetical protein M8J77_012889 [Diaphorina citri]